MQERTIGPVTWRPRRRTARPVPPTVLYVEDNLSNFKLVEKLLKRRGEVRLLTAMEGALGLQLARQHRPDLILLDLHLPGMDGEELLRRLNDGSRHCGHPRPGRERRRDQGASGGRTGPGASIRRRPARAHQPFPAASRGGFKDLERFDDTSTSLTRQAAADGWIAAAGDRSIDDILEALRDHSSSVCQHADGSGPPEAEIVTVAAVAMDLTEGALWVTEGPPCTAAAERFELGSLVARAA